MAFGGNLGRAKGFLLTLLATFILVPALFLLYVSTIVNQIDERMSQLRSSRASQFYALYPPYQSGQSYSLQQLRLLLVDQGYQEIKSVDELVQGTFVFQNSNGLPELFVHRAPFNGPGHVLDHLRIHITFENQNGLLKIKEILPMSGGSALDKFETAPKKVSSFYAGRIRSQSPVTLSDIPVSVRQSVMAIEDIHFLEHSGVSIRGTLRALLKDIRSGKKAEGGSTITQQLMKNLYFSRQKSFSRKLREAIFAEVTEFRHSKEDILEAYLNEVYLGQWNTQEIHGVSEGARFYFNQSISDVSLSQAALLAALVQSPNAYNIHADQTPLLKRRNLVLKRMLEGEFILKDEYDMAIADPLGIVPRDQLLENTGYFMELVMQAIPDSVKNRLDTNALTVYTTLNPFFQSISGNAVKANIERLTKGYPGIRKKEKKGFHLQSALIAVDVPSCSVVALQGGSNYKETQFNRVIQGKRQPGSLFKPFVFLAGFAKPAPTQPITPVTELDGTQFEWKYDRQVWKPRNYEDEYEPKVTARHALEFSMNVPTAHLAQAVGIPGILEMITHSGIKSPVPAFPSISLGSAEVTPYELAEAYTTFANLGKGCSLRPIEAIYDENKNIIFEMKANFEDRLPLVPTFETVELLKGVMVRGTGKWAGPAGIQIQNFAGKTGTTNDYKDAWFVGFSPQIMTLVWVGYDEEEKVGLTGMVAALPLWIDFMKVAQNVIPLTDFQAPPGVTAYDICPQSHLLANSRCPEKISEYFVNGTQPTATCSVH